MSRFSTAPIGAAVFIMLTGCTGVPDFDKSEEITVNHIVDHIECELYSIRRDHPKLADQLAKEQWVASASLQLTVNDLGQLTPSSTFTTPLTKLTSFAFNGSALLEKQRERIFNQNFDILFRKLGPAPCQRLASRGYPYDPQQNNLGLEEIVKMAFRAIRNDPDAFPESGAGGSGEGGGGGSGNAAGGGSGNAAGAKNTSAFSATIQFIVTKNLNAVGPTWTLQWYKGPGNLAEVARADTQLIMIEFSPGASKTAAQPHTMTSGEQSAASYNLRHLQNRHIDAAAPKPTGF
jgi:hypothetical protein